MPDPFAGIASPVQSAPDPLQGIATPVSTPPAQSDPFAGVASPVQGSAAQPNIIEKGIMGLANSPVVKGLTGSYMQGVTNGLFMQPVRAAMQATDFGGYNEKIRSLYPGQTDDWYNQRVNDLYNSAVSQSRQDAQQQTAHNPYPGHQVGNFLANVVSQPEMLLMGGSGTGATVGARVLSAGVKNAAIGGASDAAAQIMDQATGQKKNFDITQNLANAATGGVAGAAMHGATEFAPVVSDFVKGLFSERGVDTKPPENPTGVTTPTTTNSVQFTPEQATQFKQLLKTGSVDDIKNFLAGHNGPQPSWSDVNQMVQMRDGAGLPDQFTGQQNLNQALDSMISDQQHQLVSDHVAAQTAGWKNAPDIEVVRNPSEIADPAVRQNVVDQSADGSKPLGVFGSDGKVRLFSDNIPDAETANAALFHEALGHNGLTQQFGAGLDRTLQTLTDRNVGKFGDTVDQWMKDNPGAYGGSKVRAAEEVMAEMSQAGALKPSWQQALISKFRQFGRGMGLNLAYSDNEIQHILAMAHDAVINGKAGDARANGFRGTRPSANPVTSNWLNLDGTPPENKFMFTGPKATGFDPMNATEMSTGPRNEISDEGATIKAYPQSGPKTLGDVLDHPDLYAQYPHLRDVPVVHTALREGMDGAYNPKTGRMYISDTLTPENERSTILHETQHAIQDYENYPGARDNDARKAPEYDYDADPHEKEAYATEARQGMTAAERSANPPERFMTRAQLAATPGYVNDDLESVYRSLMDNYVPKQTNWAETRREALDVGFSPSQIKDLKPNELAARTWRVNAAANAALQRIEELNKRIGTPDETVADRQNWLKAVADRDYLVARAMGDASELGRALQIRKAFPSITASSMKQIAEALREHGSGLATLAEDPEKFMKFSQMIKNLMAQGNPKGANVALAGFTKPYFEQYMTSVHFNMMLASLSAQAKAPIDMMTGITRNVIERGVAVPIGLARKTVLTAIGKKSDPRVQGSEVAANVWGLARAITNAEVWKATAHALKTGDGSYVGPNNQRIASTFGAKMGMARNPDIPVVNFPSRLITAHDTFFRSVEMQSQMYALAARQAHADLVATGKKFSFDDVMARAASLAHTPSVSLLNHAMEETDRTLLLNNNPVNSWIDKAKANYPGQKPMSRLGSFVLQNLAPFIRVESNSLMNRVIARSPLFFLDPYTRAQFAAGGPQADIAAAKVAYGTVLMGLYWMAADKAKGVLTGPYPDNTNKGKEMEAGGWRPDSVKSGDTYERNSNLAMSINPFDTHNATASMVADLRDSFDKGANKGSVGTGLKLALGSILHNMASESWINDVAPTIDALTARGQDAGQKTANVIGNEAKSWVPSELGQIARMTSNTRDTRSDDANGFANITGQAINDVASAVPGLNSTLPPRYSVYGDETPTGQGIIGVHTPFGGGNETRATQDPAEQELDRLNSLIPSALITPVSRNVKIGGVPTKLTIRQFEDYQRLAGQSIVQAVREQMSTPQWQQMDDQQKVLTVKAIEKDQKKASKEYLYGQ